MPRIVNHEERASRAWPLLVRAAIERKTISYKALGQALGIHWRVVQYVLGPIQEYCAAEGLPRITVVVADQNGRRGAGFLLPPNKGLPETIEDVFAYAWSPSSNPFSYAAGGQSAADLAAALVDQPEQAADIYQLVLARGVAQTIFRDCLLDAYEGACAFCGLTFPDALDGAHIIPWGDASAQLRLSPRNGILLCATHHRLFDAGRLTLTSDHRIQTYDPKQRDGVYSDIDKMLTVALHGTRMRLPERVELRPDMSLVAVHRERHSRRRR